EAIKRIVEIELKGLYKRIEDMGYKLELSDEAKEFVATKGYDVQFGARPLKRAIQNHVEDLVCERIIDGDLSEGSVISVEKNPEKEELLLK
ncbi:MAG: ATP-dependent Clp protease ATP-binding subunit, partial [Prevotella sp.]|nr:ATP-dependent Clp protease ATP-binding subunit [Prevotella sp.]